MSSSILMLALWKTLLISAALVLPVRLETNSGEKLQGDFDSISDNTVTILQGGKARSFTFDEIRSLQPLAAQPKTGPMTLVTLVGGSRIAAQEVVLTDDGVKIEPRRQTPLLVSPRLVKAIRFRSASPSTDAHWLGLVGQNARGDTLVIRRAGDRLDPANGVVQGITDGNVIFNLEGDTIEAPIEKLEGVILGGTSDVADSAVIQITDVYGSVWYVSSLSRDGSDASLRLNLSDSVTHSIPLDHVMSIRWNSGIEMLANEKPVASSMKRGAELSVDQSLWEGFFGVESSQDDLLMHGGASAEYRVDQGYQKFIGAVRRDAQVARASKVSVRILFDGEPVWEESLPNADPRGFELPLQEARRVSIEVDGQSDGDLGDSIRIVRPRFLK